MALLWMWPMANLPSNILPVLLSCCREQGGKQRHSGLAEHHLKWLTPQSVGFLEWWPRCLFPSILHLLGFFFFFFCVFFPLPISAFCLTLHLLSSSYSNKTQLLPFCQSPGTGWSFWGLCFMCFTWSFIGKRVFYIFDLLQRGVTWGGFCSDNIFSLKKNYTFHQCNISA